MRRREMAVKCRIITCPKWGARKPAHKLQVIDNAEEIIFHHTAGHHREIDTPGKQTIAESIRYAKDIQAYHMSQGWSDSGHNFLVCRNGIILQGRWLTVSTIQVNRMVQSAHCPEHNDDIGIEHEHKGSEPMTDAQRNASARLMAWIADQYGRKNILPVQPHRAYYATACPANLVNDIPKIKALAEAILDRERDRA
jgi:hypothetical protein